ncbi:MAG: 2-amino-4-hydroxy-6-hydroxymethyldihydropteridine diphosphokinase [Pseudomonadota bacterium]
METHIAFISVGSNMGDRNANCRIGIAAVGASDGVVLTGISRFYETEPVDFIDQDWFVNAAVRIETTLSPVDLLDTLKRIEKTAGRKESALRFGPRVLDLDIILFDDRVMNTDRLVIPHPRMHERRFVLTPVCDIDPFVTHPVLNRSVQAILSDLSGDIHQRVVEHGVH